MMTVALLADNDEGRNNNSLTDSVIVIFLAGGSLSVAGMAQRNSTAPIGFFE